MDHLTANDYQVMPWRNGGGSTTEIAIGPHGAGLDGTPFIWRVSMADVAVDGPFSAFAGYDRNLTMLEGNGIVLDAGDKGRFDIDEPYRPVAFSGDWRMEGRLIDGPIRDFNVMTARGKATAAVTMLDVGSNEISLSGAASVLLLHMFEGEPVTIGPALLRANETLIDRASKSYDLTLRTTGGQSRLGLVAIECL